MNATHLLVRKAIVQKKADVSMNIHDSIYNTSLGLWIWMPTGEYYVKSNHSSYKLQMTKKADIETGEDVKGI